MYRRQALGQGVALAMSRLWDAALAVAYFAILLVRPSHRVHYGQQFLYKTEGETFERSFAAFGATADGRRLLDQRPESVAMLRDRARLQALSPGSLGRSYYDFMTAEKIDEDLYLDGAIEAGKRLECDPARAWFRIRVEAGHDVRHVLTDYGIDLFGETCLLAFRFGQNSPRGHLCDRRVRITRARLSTPAPPDAGDARGVSARAHGAAARFAAVGVGPGKTARRAPAGIWHRTAALLPVARTRDRTDQRRG